ncbi:Gfo/Idh/MocA family oxidoreductase [Candidatus Fermentibacterales bacterium]|nr:Gfo/Idh/MocA family oxidoreductase [Candidatus Fermentibacterales bacterium]
MTRAGVVGVGHLGFHHARILRSLVDEVRVCDTRPGRAAEVSRELDVRSSPSLDAILGESDLIVAACTTSAHYDVVSSALSAGLPVLVEKPIASTLDQGQRLVGMAERAGLVLAVGHVERFNPAITAAARLIKEPMFVEGHRLARFQPRGTDVSVVMDLMIHDIDLVLSFVTSGIAEVRASGLPVLSEKHDIVSARLSFHNGAVVNMTASRISREPMRKLRFFESNRYVSVDFAARKVEAYALVNGSISQLPTDVPEHDALEEELRDFLAACRGEREPAVPGRAGVRALGAAEAITREIEKSSRG